MESRSTDVYVAQCFANGETGLSGKQALLAWKIDSGSWNGVKLDGLHVAGAVTANATLGDPYGEPYPAKVVMLVDDRATPEQRTALVAFAQHEAGQLFDNIVKTESVPMELEVPQAADCDGTRPRQRRWGTCDVSRREPGANRDPLAER